MESRPLTCRLLRLSRGVYAFLVDVFPRPVFFSLAHGGLSVAPSESIEVRSFFRPSRRHMIMAPSLCRMMFACMPELLPYGGNRKGDGGGEHVCSCVVLQFPRSASTVVPPSTPGARAASSRYVAGPSSVFCVDTLSCGSQHCLALMASNQVVGWGFNSHGQVGTGPKGKHSTEKRRVAFCMNINESATYGHRESISSKGRRLLKLCYRCDASVLGLR